MGPDGRVYVADFGNHCVQVFSSEWRHVLSIGQQGAAPGEFVNPVSVALDGSHQLFVADQGNHRIQIFDTEGHLLRVFGAKGRDAGQFSSPMGLAVDALGRVYVADSGNQRVQMLSAAGEALTVIGGSLESGVDRPVDVAVSDSRLYVSDAGRHSVQRYTIRALRP